MFKILEQIDDKCLNCQERWIQDEFQENCHPICGDGIIQDGFVINTNFYFDPLCGDGNLTPYSVEQCELTVNGVWDGCYDCKLISIAICKTNYFSICLECEVGFQNLENACFPYCGDKLVLQQYEDCDDGNFEPYDGCYQCKFQCIENCNICDQGKCILKCGDGYEFVNNNCHSFCGDYIVTKEDDCKDGNTIEFDGCFQYKYSYPEYCYDCFQGTCLECNDQYQLLISNQCKQQFNCGDGLLQEEEECDDGNYYAADGCKDCLIEQILVCITMTTDSPSQCTFLKAPSLVINYFNMTKNTQYISIQFTYPYQKLQFLNYQIQIRSTGNSSLYIVQDVGSYLSFGEYIVEIETTLKNFSKSEVANIDNAILDVFEKQITLQYPNYLEETQKDYSQSLKLLNKYLICSLFGITIISLLLGSGDLFVEILATLQFQQYLRQYNNQHIMIITVQPLLDFMHFSQLLKSLDIEANQEYSQGKFNVYKQNSSLITNLQCQIIQNLILLLLMFLFRWVKRVMVMYSSRFCSRYFYYMSSLSKYINPKVILKIRQFFYKICLELFKLEKLISFEGLQKALLLNS